MIQRYLSLLFQAPTYYPSNEQIVSQSICEALTSQEVSQYIQDEGYTHLIKCFLNPHKYMIRQDENQQMLYQSQSESACTQPDPIYELFDPEKTSKLGKPKTSFLYFASQFII